MDFFVQSFSRYLILYIFSKTNISIVIIMYGINNTMRCEPHNKVNIYINKLSPPVNSLMMTQLP